MRFSEVVGQQNVKQRFASMVNSGRIPHALLLLGPEGSGGLPLALALATFIQCEQKVEGDSCGICSSCQRNAKLIHPDVHFTYPVVRNEDLKRTGPPVSADWITEWRLAVIRNPYMPYSDWLQQIGAENRQGNITADECRHVIQQLNLKTFENGYKIQIIWLAEHLGYEGNILLKSLEEPPPNTVFILVAENGEHILNTVLSRVQIVKINGIDDDDVADTLMRRFDMDEETARRLSRIADGNFDAAVSMAQGEDSAHDKTLRQWLLFCWYLKLKPSGSNAEQLLQWIEAFAKTGRENQKVFLKYALFFLRECAMVALTGQSKKLQGEEFQFAQKLTGTLDVHQLESLSKLFNKLYYHIERNGNVKALLLSNSFKIGSVFKNLPVAAE